MIDEHEYAVLGGFNRTLLGRYLAMASAAISAGIVYLLLLAVDLAQRFGLPRNIPPSLLSLVGAGAVYVALYWLLNRFAWKIAFVSKLLKVPDLTGTWKCDGQTINPDKTPGYVWRAEISVVQSWDKIRVRLRTAQSSSVSITAALVYDDTDGCRLLYNYMNEPKIGEIDLKAHRGFAEVTFAPDRRSGRGEYFNGHGRFTFGTMAWTKEGK